MAQSIFKSFSWGQFFANQIIRHKQEELVITWCGVQTIRRLHNNLPSKLSELLGSHYQCMYVVFCFVLMKHGRWTLLNKAERLSLQKWFDFDMIQQRFGYFLVKSYDSSLLQYLAPGNRNSAHMSVWLEDFQCFIDITNSWPSSPRCIRITETKSTKLKLCLIVCYSIRTINAYHIFSCLTCVGKL